MITAANETAVHVTLLMNLTFALFQSAHDTFTSSENFHASEPSFVRRFSCSEPVSPTVQHVWMPAAVARASVNYLSEQAKSLWAGSSSGHLRPFRVQTYNCGEYICRFCVSPFSRQRRVKRCYHPTTCCVKGDTVLQLGFHICTSHVLAATFLHVISCISVKWMQIWKYGKHKEEWIKALTVATDC